MAGKEILIIDDEAQIRKLLSITLETEGFTVRYAENARLGVASAKSQVPDLILLDLGLPDESGHEVLRKLRTWYDRPIIILSVQSDEENIVKALDNGANDYLVKPFRTGELIARIRSALRRVNSLDHLVYINGAFQFDVDKRACTVSGQEVKLTASEYKIISYLIKNEGRVLTHSQILKEVWGAAHQEQTQNLRVFIAQLRKKVEVDPNRPQLILTESGVGYRLKNSTIEK